MSNYLLYGSGTNLFDAFAGPAFTEERSLTQSLLYVNLPNSASSMPMAARHSSPEPDLFSMRRGSLSAAQSQVQFTIPMDFTPMN
jgi:hypothetical protein